jgi:hypothetical protein
MDGAGVVSASIASAMDKVPTVLLALTVLYSAPGWCPQCCESAHNCG